MNPFAEVSTVAFRRHNLSVPAFYNSWPARRDSGIQNRGTQSRVTWYVRNFCSWNLLCPLPGRSVFDIPILLRKRGRLEDTYTESAQERLRRIRIQAGCGCFLVFQSCKRFTRTLRRNRSSRYLTRFWWRLAHPSSGAIFEGRFLSKLRFRLKSLSPAQPFTNNIATVVFSLNRSHLASFLGFDSTPLCCFCFRLIGSRSSLLTPESLWASGVLDGSYWMYAEVAPRQKNRFFLAQRFAAF